MNGALGRRGRRRQRIWTHATGAGSGSRVAMLQQPNPRRIWDALSRVGSCTASILDGRAAAAGAVTVLARGLRAPGRALRRRAGTGPSVQAGSTVPRLARPPPYFGPNP